VLENVVPTLIGGAAFIQLLKQLGFGPDVVRVVLNQYTTAAGNPSLADTERRLELPIDFVIPAHRKIQSAANLGRPFILSASRWWQPGKGMLPLVTDIDSLRAAGEREASASVGSSSPTDRSAAPREWSRTGSSPSSNPGTTVNSQSGPNNAPRSTDADFGEDS
jgi:hypothetical protein